MRIFSLILSLFLAVGSVDAAIGDWSSYTRLTIRQICARSGEVWAATEGGITRSDLLTGLVSKYTPTEGLSDETIYCVALDEARNTVWFGSQYGGLIRFSSQPGTQPVLGSSLLTDEVTSVRALALGGDRLYIGHSTGITVLDLTTLRVVETYHQLGNGAQNEQILSLAVIGDNLYAATANGLSSGNVNDNLLLPGSWTRTTGTSFTDIEDMAEFDGKLYIASRDGVMRRNQPGIWDPVGISDSTSSLAVFDGALWAATNAGLYQSTDGASWSQHSALTSSVHALSAVGNTMLVVAGYDGTYRIDSRTSTTAEKIPGVDSPPITVIADMAIDTSGAVWCVSRQKDIGVFRLKDDRWTHYPQRSYGLPGVADRSGYSSVAVDDRNRVWVGTWGKGIVILDPSTDPPGVTLINNTTSPMTGLTGGPSYIAVKDLVHDSEGHMLAAVVHSLGFSINADYPETSTPFNHFFSSYLASMDVSTNMGASSIALGDDGILWVGADTHNSPSVISGGLVLYDTGETLDDMSDDQLIGTMGVEVGSQAGVLSEDVYCLTVDRSGTVWVGTGAGLTAIDGTYDRSLNQFVPTTRHYTTNHNLPANRIQALLTDSHNYVWVGTSGGLARINPSGVVEVMDGSKLINTSVKSLAFDEERGYLWIGTPSGLNRYEAYAPQSGNAVAGQPLQNPYHIGLTQQGTDYVLTGDPLTIQVTPRARVRIYTVLGELVWDETDEGAGQVSWDGRTASGGSIVASGVYFYVVESDGSYHHGKIAVVRDAQ